MKTPLVLVLLCACLRCAAQAADAPQPAPAGGEPAVQRGTVEDKGTKIEQLRVRGQVQRVVVTPKFGPAKPYEIIVRPDGRAPTGPGEGAAGQRVWNLLNF